MQSIQNKESIKEEFKLEVDHSYDVNTYFYQTWNTEIDVLEYKDSTATGIIV